MRETVAIPAIYDIDVEQTTIGKTCICCRQVKPTSCANCPNKDIRPVSSICENARKQFTYSLHMGVAAKQD